MALKTTLWKTEDYLETPTDVAFYLEAVLEDGDPELLNAALGDIARSKGMSEIARRSGLGRQSLYKALSPAGRPEFATVVKVLRALGLTLAVKPVTPRARKPSVYRKPARGRPVAHELHEDAAATYNAPKRKRAKKKR